MRKQTTDCKSHLRLSEDNVRCKNLYLDITFLKNSSTYSVLSKVYNTNYMQVSFITGHKETQDGYIFSLLSKKWTEIFFYMVNFFFTFILEWQIIYFHILYVRSHICLY